MPVSSVACRFWLLFALITLKFKFEFCFMLRASRSQKVQIQALSLYASVWFCMQAFVLFALMTIIKERESPALCSST